MGVELVVLLVLGLLLACGLLQLRWLRATSQRVHGTDKFVRAADQRRVQRAERQDHQAAALAEVVKGQQAVIATMRDEQEAARAENARLAQELRHQLDRAVRTVRRGGADDMAQVEAMLQLLRLADLREAIPRTRVFPASPDTLLALVDLVRRERPALYFELGSGTSTVVVASAARAAGIDLRIVSADHDADYAEQTRRLVARHGLTDMVEVRHAPLVPLATDPDRRWYDTAAIDDLVGIDVCFVDGPPGATNPQARLPAMEFVPGRLAPRAFVLIDDSMREDERAMADAWALQPGVVEVVRPFAEKGLDVLEIRSVDR